MEPRPGQDCHCGESTETERDDSERCDQCGAKLEWTLDLDGVQRRECPNCGG